MPRTRSHFLATRNLTSALSPRSQVSVLPYDIFEELFHGIFKQDEWKLFAVGGMMGALVGLGQNYLLHL